jgi:hypothetical protein
VGLTDGLNDGKDVGKAVGNAVGNLVGKRVVGNLVGNEVGNAVGTLVVGYPVGKPEGEAVGNAVGPGDGLEVGVFVGLAVGDTVGDAVGEFLISIFVVDVLFPRVRLPDARALLIALLSSSSLKTVVVRVRNSVCRRRLIVRREQSQLILTSPKDSTVLFRIAACLSINDFSNIWRASTERTQKSTHVNFVFTMMSCFFLVGDDVGDGVGESDGAVDGEAVGSVGLLVGSVVQAPLPHDEPSHSQQSNRSQFGSESADVHAKHTPE